MFETVSCVSVCANLSLYVRDRCFFLGPNLRQILEWYIYINGERERDEKKETISFANEQRVVRFMITDRLTYR